MFYSKTQAVQSCGNDPRLAYSIQASLETAKQVPRLLDAIWHECNLYAVHFDAKMSPNDRDRIASFLRSQYPHNLIVVPSRRITYAGVSMLLATLDSLSLLISRHRDVPWSFYINLSAADYPLVAPNLVRKAFSYPDLRNVNFFQSQVATKSAEWFFTRRFSSVHLDPSLWNISSQLTSLSVSHAFAHAKALPIRKAEGWIIISHEFAQYALNSSESRTLLALFANVRAADEHFFPTLQAMAPKGKFPFVCDALRHIAWSNGTHMLPRPAQLDGSLAPVLREALFNSGALFARKFGSGGQLQDQIDCAMSGLYGSAGCSEEDLKSVLAHTLRVERRIACIIESKNTKPPDRTVFESCLRYSLA